MENENQIAYGAGIGLLIGIIIGSFTGHVNLWISLGLCFSAGIGMVFNKKSKS